MKYKLEICCVSGKKYVISDVEAPTRIGGPLSGLINDIEEAVDAGVYTIGEPEKSATMILLNNVEYIRILKQEKKGKK